MSPKQTGETNAGQLLMQLGSGLWLSRALWTAAHLRIADSIPEGDPVQVSQIANATATAPDSLRRLLHVLASVGVFQTSDGERFGHSAASLLLRTDHPASQRAFIDSVFGKEHYEAWGALDDAIRTGEAAFDRRFGKPTFDWFAEHPEAAALFGEAMTGTTRILESAILAAYDFGAFDLAVDIGGNEASLLRGILAARPDGRGIVFDLPGTIAASERAWGGTAEAARLTGVGGDFFDSVPGGGDLYLLKFILHDWTDDKCLGILRNIRRAMRPDGRVVIVEMVMPDDATQPHPARFMDLNMLAMTGGRERTVSAFRDLLEAAAFRLDVLTPTESPVSVITARPI